MRYLGDAETDFKLEIELLARHKKGPTYAEPRHGTNLVKGIASLGLAPSSYYIIADFDATYRLLHGETEVLTKAYTVSDRVDHERGDFESFNSLNDFAGQMLEKHMILTLNDFFGEAAARL